MEETAEKAEEQVPDQVCDSIETQFSHMRVQSLRWKPEQQPFDPLMAAAVRNLSQGLAVTGRDATTQPVRVRVTATVTALNRLGVAIGRGKDATRVLATLGKMRVQYGALTAACDPGSKSSSETTSTTQTRPTSPAKAREPIRLGPICRKVQGVMVTVGVDLADWSPEADPFDKATAAKWRAFGNQLGALARRAGSAPIRTAIKQNAGAFTGIADAMGLRHRDAVNDSLREAGLAYLDIHRECSLP